jgi:hypothetical protein
MPPGPGGSPSRSSIASRLRRSASNPHPSSRKSARHKRTAPDQNQPFPRARGGQAKVFPFCPRLKPAIAPHPRQAQTHQWLDPRSASQFPQALGQSRARGERREKRKTNPASRRTQSRQNAINQTDRELPQHWQAGTNALMNGHKGRSPDKFHIKPTRSQVHQPAQVP